MPSQYPPLVSVGLVTWNSAVHLSACLNALAQQAYPSLELIAVDNASVDDSAAQLKALSPTAHLICNTVNTGYCGGHNQAIRISRGAYYLPLNPDVVMKPDYVAALVDATRASSHTRKTLIWRGARNCSAGGVGIHPRLSPFIHAVSARAAACQWPPRFSCTRSRTAICFCSRTRAARGGVATARASSPTIYKSSPISSCSNDHRWARSRSSVARGHGLDGGGLKSDGAHAHGPTKR